MSSDPAGFSPRVGAPLMLAQGLRLVLAPNASPMTERGTNSYLLGERAVTVIDPGPADPAHVAALIAALPPGAQVAQIVVTHAHLDHSPAARLLAQATGAPILAFGGARDGRSARMAALDLSDLGAGEGLDLDFAPDTRLAHGAQIAVEGGTLDILHTPGHLGGHICLRWGGAVFSGDHLMGWAPSLISPPDGDLTDFMASLALIEALGPVTLYPGHGAPVARGDTRAAEIRTHRLAREAAVLAAAAAAPGETALALTERVYADVPKPLIPAAFRNLLAHLIDLESRGRITLAGAPGPQARVHAT